MSVFFQAVLRLLSSPSPSPSSTPSPSPTPTPTAPVNPVAAFTPQNGTTYTFGSSVVLDASSSTGGFDTVACPIQNFTWTVSYPNSTLLGNFSGQVVSFTAQTASSLTVRLTVTASDLSSSPSSSYNSTSTAVATIHIPASQIGQTASIQVFTNKALSQNVSTPLYGPQELVQIYALVDYGGAPVPANYSVSFAVFYPTWRLLPN